MPGWCESELWFRVFVSLGVVDIHVIVGPEMLAPCRVELGVYFVLVESLRPDGFFQVLLYGEP